MNLSTAYVGGDGYHGMIGEDGKFAANDLPEIVSHASTCRTILTQCSAVQMKNQLI